jgi:hypothetical protein
MRVAPVRGEEGVPSSTPPRPHPRGFRRRRAAGCAPRRFEGLRAPGVRGGLCAVIQAGPGTTLDRAGGPLREVGVARPKRVPGRRRPERGGPRPRSPLRTATRPTLSTRAPPACDPEQPRRIRTCRGAPHAAGSASGRRPLARRLNGVLDEGPPHAPGSTGPAGARGGFGRPWRLNRRRGSSPCTPRWPSRGSRTADKVVGTPASVGSGRRTSRKNTPRRSDQGGGPDAELDRADGPFRDVYHARAEGPDGRRSRSGGGPRPRSPPRTATGPRCHCAPDRARGCGQRRRIRRCLGAPHALTDHRGAAP